MSKSKEELEQLSVDALESHLDEARATEPRDYLVGVMAVRNAKIRQAELDHWCLTAEQYDAAIHASEAVNRAKGELYRAQVILRRHEEWLADPAVIESVDPEELKAGKEDAAEARLRVEECKKTLADAPKKSKLAHLQDAQRTAMKELRAVQTAYADPALVGLKSP